VSEQDAILDRLFRAIEDEDIDAVVELYAADIEVWHNSSGRSLERTRSLALLRSFLDRVSEARYEVLERRHWAGGAVQRHVLHMQLSGAHHSIDACIVFAFDDGRITRVFEYADGRSLAPLGW
jgi:ketosteroid isomerase-like protein